MIRLLGGLLLLGLLSLVTPASAAIITASGACPDTAAKRSSLGIQFGDLCYRTDTLIFAIWDGTGWRTILTTTSSGVFLQGPAVTAGAGTVNAAAAVQRSVYKSTLTFANFSAAALTADATIATLPAKVRLTGIIADVTTAFTGGAVSAATMVCGKTAGGNEYLVSFDVFTAAILIGDADAELGASITRAGSIQGGDLPSWTATTAAQCRLTTVTANTDALTAGTIIYYLITEAMP